MSISVSKILIGGALAYGVSTYGSYKYSQFTKAQRKLLEVKDQKAFLHDIHQKIAERYDKLYEKREFSNKLNKYRKILLSYAEGNVLEIGIGTSGNIQYYTNNVEVSIICFPSIIIL
jgi:hypothetical protein